MAEERPESRLRYQDFADAHAYGAPPGAGMYWCMAKLAGMDFEDFMAEDESVLDDFSTDFTLAATRPPEGKADAVPVYSEAEGIRYVSLELLYAAARPEMRLRRGTVRDVMETQEGDPGPLAQQRLLARLSGWDPDEIKTISLYDWNAILAARRNFRLQPSVEASPTG